MQVLLDKLMKLKNKILFPVSGSGEINRRLIVSLKIFMGVSDRHRKWRLLIGKQLGISAQSPRAGQKLGLRDSSSQHVPPPLSAARLASQSSVLEVEDISHAISSLLLKFSLLEC